MIKSLPPVEYLRECFEYDPDTGVLTWKERPREHFVSENKWHGWNTRYARTEAANIHSKGYLEVTLGNRKYLLHRIIYKLFTGDEPPEQLDHQDLDKMNNRCGNLRPATNRENAWNTGLRASNMSGRRGVCWHRKAGKWQAAITINYVTHYLGLFGTIEEASIAYENVASRLYGNFHVPSP